MPGGVRRVAVLLGRRLPAIHHSSCTGSNRTRRGRATCSRILPAMTTAHLRTGGIDRGDLTQLAAISAVGVLAVVLRLADASPVLVFVVAGIAVAGMAHLLGIATEQAGEAAGPRLSALLNATFGNAAEI